MHNAVYNRIARWLLLGIVPAILSLGCESTTAEEGSRAAVATDAEFYSPSDAVRVSVTNVTGEYIYYVCDGQVRLLEIENGSVINAWLVHGDRVCDDKPSIAPATRTNFFISLRSFQELQDEARFNSSVRYRFEVELYSDPECTIPLTDSDRRSNDVAIIR